MEKLVLDILSSGSLSFVFSKLVKALGEKELGEIIAASGWVVVGIDVLSIIYPIAKTITGSIEKTAGSFAKVAEFFKLIEHFVGK